MARTDALMRLLDATLTAAIVHGADAFGEGVGAWCQTNQISRATFYRHRRRIIAERCWKPRSRRPRSCPHATPEPVEKQIVRLRQELAGGEAGAENIAYRLGQIALEQDWAVRGWRVPSRATIHRVLRRHGLVVDQPKKRPKSSYRRFAYARPRDCYQIDATEVVLAGGAKAVVFEVLDDCTRTLVATRAAPAETTAGALAAIRAAFADFGVPGIVLSDNGRAFTTSGHSRGGRSRFTTAVTTSGARLIHSTPYHPQTCGKVERHHRTFKQWLAGQPAPATLRQLQARCTSYQRWYNQERRHSVWNRPPAQAWAEATQLGGPEHLPLQRDAHLRRHKVSATGVVGIGSVLINLGRPHAHEHVTTIQDDHHVTIYADNGTCLGHLTIDHNKRYQGKLQPAAA